MKSTITLQRLAGLLATGLLTSVASAQNVGIGTTTPKSKLSVNGTTASGGMAIGDATYTSTTGTVAPVNGAIIQGNVGVGTPAPQHLMHVVDGNFFRENSNGNASTLISTDGGIRVFRNGPALATPTVNGYVDVRNDPASGTSYGRMHYYKGVAGQPTPLDAGEGLAFAAGTITTTPQVLLEANTGELGVATLNPRTRLEVAGITTIWGGTFPSAVNCLSIGWNSGGLKPGQGVAEFVNYSGTGGGNGYDFYRVPLSQGAPTAGHLIASITAAGAYVQVSDKRTKTGVQPLRHGLKEVMALEPKEYDFHAPSSMADGKVELGDSSVHQIGFLAQDVMAIVPEAVEKPQDPAKGLYTMNYTGLVPVLVKAIQEQQSEIDSLKAKLSAVEEENRTAKAQSASLKDLAARMEALEKVVAITAPAPVTPTTALAPAD